MIGYLKARSGVMIIVVLLAGTLFIILAGGLISVGLYRYKLYLQQTAKQQALHVAEAGINYYRWHLAHDHDDYYDGTGADPGSPGEPYGPYAHSYTAPSSGAQGTFEIEITPPPTGSTIVSFKATGWMNDYPSIKRSIEVYYGIPSLADYSFLTHSDSWFGSSEGVRGKMHSNGGVRMDGTNDSTVSSARSTYSCPAGHACNTQATCASPCNWIVASSTCLCPGVWGAGTGSSLWRYPVPAIDFSLITMDLAEMKGLATSSGVYLPASGGGNYGYHITFLANGTFDARVVSALQAQVRQYNDTWTGWSNIREQIQTEGSATNYSIPANGIIFVDDDVWVDGTVNGRATLAAARLPDTNPSNRKSITINDNLTYVDRNGSHILGLIGQKNVKVPRYAPSVLTIDAFMLAQYGRIYYNNYDTNSLKTSIEVYGGIISNLVWTWSWISGSTVVDGYATTTSIFDTNGTFAPPPSFPTTGEYTFISWEEI